MSNNQRNQSIDQDYNEMSDRDRDNITLANDNANANTTPQSQDTKSKSKESNKSSSPKSKRSLTQFLERPKCKRLLPASFENDTNVLSRTESIIGPDCNSLDMESSDNNFYRIGDDNENSETVPDQGPGQTSEDETEIYNLQNLNGQVVQIQNTSANSSNSSNNTDKIFQSRPKIFQNSIRDINTNLTSSPLSSAPSSRDSPRCSCDVSVSKSSSSLSPRNGRDFQIIDYDDDTSEDLSTDNSPVHSLMLNQANSSSAFTRVNRSRDHHHHRDQSISLSLSKQNQINFQILAKNGHGRSNSEDNSCLDMVNSGNYEIGLRQNLSKQSRLLNTQSLDVMPPEVRMRLDLSDGCAPGYSGEIVPILKSQEIGPEHNVHDHVQDPEALNTSTQPSQWTNLPTDIIYKICQKLPIQDAVNFTSSTKKFHQKYSKDKYLWKKLFYRDMQGRPEITLSTPVNNDFRETFKKISYETPRVSTHILRDCSDEVLHVAFSPDGRFLAVCAKDAVFRVYKGVHPYNLLYKNNIGGFRGF